MVLVPGGGGAGQVDAEPDQPAAFALACSPGGSVAVPAVRSLFWALGIFVVFTPRAVRFYRRKT